MGSNIQSIDYSKIKFRNYPADRLIIDNKTSKYSKLSSLEKKIRKWIINYIINNGKPFNLNNSAQEGAEILGLDIEDFKEFVKGLHNKMILVMDEESNVNFIYPISALPTNHQVTLEDGRKYSAMCAIDAMGAAFTFNQDVTVESVCSQCGEKITVTIKDGKIVDLVPKDTHVLHVDLLKIDNWAASC